MSSSYSFLNKFFHVIPQLWPFQVASQVLINVFEIYCRIKFFKIILLYYGITRFTFFLDLREYWRLARSRWPARRDHMDSVHKKLCVYCPVRQPLLEDMASLVLYCNFQSCLSISSVT